MCRTLEESAFDIPMYFEKQDYRRGDLLFQKGQPADAIWFVVEGEITLQHADVPPEIRVSEDAVLFPRIPSRGSVLAQDSAAASGSAPSNDNINAFMQVGICVATRVNQHV